MDQETARIEHLKLIQAVIARLARHSFAVKSLAVAAAAALITFTAATETPVAVIGGAALLPLWWLDATYLRQERRFRSLYDFVRAEPAAEFGARQYFSMDVSIPRIRDESILQVAVRLSHLLVYLPLLVLLGLSSLMAVG